MRRILTTFSQKWPEYLLEILVITVGILGAFALNNWNENRKASSTEIQILKNLKAEVELNIKELQYTMDMHTVSFESSAALLRLFGKDVSEIPFSRIDTLMSLMETVWTFEARDGTFKSVISSGNLDYLQNDSLKAMITALDGQIINAIQETEHIHRLYHERLWPLIDGKINSSSRIIAYGWQKIPTGSYDSDYQWMFDNREVEDIISNTTSWFLSVIGDEEMLMEHLQKLLKLINQELARK